MVELTHNMIATSHSRCNLLIMHTLPEAVSTNLQLIDVIKLFLKNHFINRITPVWNFLPEICFANDSLQSFKNKLYSLDFIRFLCGRL